MKTYRAEQVVRWMDMRDHWKLVRWQRRILKELLKEQYGVNGLRKRVDELWIR